MSKKHFIALADELRFARESFVDKHGEPAFNAMLELCVSFCRTQNYGFKADRFRDYIAGACGPNGGQVKQKAA